MTDTPTTAPDARERCDRYGLIQCGWCPTIMADDLTALSLHFATVHHYATGYSYKPIKGTEWDMAELVPSHNEGVQA